MMRTADSLSQVGAGCCVHVDSIYVMPAREGLYSGETMALFFFLPMFYGCKGEAWDGVNARSKFSVR